MSAEPLAPQSKPEAEKIGSRLNSVRSNVDGNLGLIFWLAPLPTVGLTPLIASSFIVPCRSQENQFLDGTCTQTTPLLFGEQAVPALTLVLMHLAECWTWAIQSPTE